MKTVRVATVEAHERVCAEYEAKALAQFPEYERAEYMACSGAVHLWANGAYPSIVRDFGPKIEFI